MYKNDFVKRVQGRADIPMLFLALGMVILASVACMVSDSHCQKQFVSPEKGTEKVSTGLTLQEGLTIPHGAPQITGITAWLNSAPLSTKDLLGKVVLVDFWTYGCINCVRTLPYITEWDSKYRNQGLVIIGIHSPEFSFEKDIDNVKAAVAQNNIHYPVALDNHLDTWKNFDNRYWPAHYLIDRNGHVVYAHLGEGGYDVTENNIRYLLGDSGRTPRAENENVRYGCRFTQAHQSPHSMEFKDCPNCASMVVIPPGSFEMGKEPNQHRVTISHPFALGKYEVTQAEWQAVMGSNPSHEKGASLPVEQVSWNDIQEFIRLLSRETGKNYRLPSEAEWEYACRAGDADKYCGGDDVDRVGWYGAASDSEGNSDKMTHPVGSKQANAFGLYDMSGNVWEWVEDPWHDTYAGAPADGSVWQGDGTKRVIRGGSWLDYPLLARADFRVWAGAGKRSGDLGFRLAMSLPKR